MIGGSFSGHFDLRVYDAYTGRLTKSRSFPNLITDQGLAGYCSGNPLFYDAFVCVGDGTATPQVTDTTLSHFLAYSNTPISASGGFNGGVENPSAPDWISKTKGTARFNAGRFDGTTITELGIANGESAARVWCRALILDEHGMPSSITVLANEYLDVTYTLSYHPNLSDEQFTFVMSGVTYECTARAAWIGNCVFSERSPLCRNKIGFFNVYAGQTLGEITGEPLFQPGERIEQLWRLGATLVPYSNITPFTHKTSQNLPLGSGNLPGGIGAALLGGTDFQSDGINNYTQVSFNPKLPKDANTSMTFTFAKTISRWQEP